MPRSQTCSQPQDRGTNEKEQFDSQQPVVLWKPAADPAKGFILGRRRRKAHCPVPCRICLMFVSLDMRGPSRAALQHFGVLC